jgi:hypothetical protein
MKLVERGMIVAGCPVGEADFISGHADESDVKVQSLVHTLMDLNLPAQDKLLLLRKALQVKMAHLARSTMYEHIAGAFQKSEHAITQAVLQIIGRDESDLDMEQLKLPLRKGGLGIQCLAASNGIVCKAGFLSAAALAQQALVQGSKSLQPFEGECC